MAHTEQFPIKNRWNGEVIFTAEITCSADSLPSIKLGLAVKAALKAGANLARANLTDANLTGADLAVANLTDANLTGADLADADLARANLAGANLARANLAGANLAGANLARADLARANLTDANLTGADLAVAYLADANLTDANLTGADLAVAYLADANLARADLTGADLTGANLTGADLARAYLARAKNLTDEQLRPFKADMWMTLAHRQAEIPGLIGALLSGRVDGSQYEGECACLVGTIANVAGVKYHTLDHNADHPAERWFMMIGKGDKPGDNTGGGFAAQKALDWAVEFAVLIGIDPSVPPVQAEAA